jgi:hypothetical protein
VRWSAPANTGGLAVTAYRVRVLDSVGDQVGRLRAVNAAATRIRVGGLANGEAYRFQVAALNEAGLGGFSDPSEAVVPGTRPAAPALRPPVRGADGGRLTVTARWSAPEAVPEVTAYRVFALKVESRAGDAHVLRRVRSGVLDAGRRTFRFGLGEGLYRFRVVAWNERGRSAPSQLSRAVRAR